MTERVPLWLVGASGMLAGECLRLLEGHPRLALAGAASREPGRPLAELHPHLATRAATIDLGAAIEGLRAALGKEAGARAALVLGLPHGAASGAWSEIRGALGDAASRVVVVDLSADHRLRDPGRHARWYGAAHPDPEALREFVYGLPEERRGELRRATRIAAPGCFATALQLGALPPARLALAREDVPWVFTAVTGSSGSGAEPRPGTHHPYRHGNLWAYALDGHRHEAELAQSLAEHGCAPPVVFVPHSGPFVRGIHLTAVIPLREPLPPEAARALYRESYAGEPFVEVLAGGVPDLRRVAGSNRASLGVHAREDALVVLVALDNLVKGGAGQALQCLNLALGFPETEGLGRAGLGVL